MKLSYRGSADRLLAFVCMLIMAAAGLPAQANSLEYKLGPVPDWVVPLTPASAPRKPHSAVRGVEALLSDMQTRIDSTGKTTFVHIASKPVASSGVDAAGNIAISFEPTYEVLTLHAINLIRDGRQINQLASARINVLQREKELEYRIYDGRKTVNVELDDLRVGDTVEYAYSVAGLNPVFGNKVSGAAALQFSVPVDRVFLRVLAPVQRPLSFNALNTRLQPTLTEAGGYRDYRWHLVSMPGLRAEKDAPAGFDAQAGVAWTEFTDWSSVVQWALPLYRHAAPGAALRGEIARIEAASAAAPERLRAVLRLVQRDIRYLGVEIGASSHAPASPDVVFKRRFGDCKDKATLMVAMLAALGIEAQPVLVHSEGLGAKAQPTPHAFDHVIVRAVANGVTYWLDPTRAEQQGDLAHLYQPDFGMALVLRETSTGLTAMPREAPAARTVRATFDASAGAQLPVAYSISTTVRGKAADAMRAQLASKGSAAMDLEYLNFYARTYPAIKAAKPLAVSDDLAANALTLTESYSIGQFWHKQGKQKRQQGFIRSSELGGRLAAPQALNRIAPLRIDYPDEVDETTIVRLPVAWETGSSTLTVTDPAFTFTHSSEPTSDGRGMIFKDRYRALADRVQSSAMPAYAEHLREANEEVGRWIYMGNKSAPSIQAHVDWRAVVAMMLFMAAILFSLLMHTSQPVHRATDLQLMLVFLATAVALVMSIFLVSAQRHLLLIALAALPLLALSMRRIARAAPASHWIYPLVHSQSLGQHHKLVRVAVRSLPECTILLAAICVALLTLSS